LDSTTSAERDRRYPLRFFNFILVIPIASFPINGKTAFDNSPFNAGGDVGNDKA
jgi:hypothetical protein